MKAVRIHEHGGPDVLRWEEIPSMDCPPDKLKVQIKAAALNHLDIWVRNGLPGIPIPLPLIMGSDGSGVVVEVGGEVTEWKAGDEVIVQPSTFCGSCDFCRTGRENYCPRYGIIGETENGVQATEVILRPVNVYKKPSTLNFEEAASVPLVFLTSYQMLVKRADLKKGETVLIYGATSGVGSAAIQIAKHIGARVITTVGSREKFFHAEKMGADYVVDHSSESWYKEVRGIVKRGGVDVVFEHIGPATWKSGMRLLAKGGRLVTCGATTGPFVEIDLRHLFMKQQTILGSTMSDLPTFREVMDLMDAGTFIPFIDRVFPFSEVAAAHRYLENRKQFGKIVLSNQE